MVRRISGKRTIEINHFYEILKDLEGRLGGKRQLRNSNGKMNWPKRGVYFFFEKGETRKRINEPRVVRVGTHALKCNSKTTLWSRLQQHRGYIDGRGNHRGSVFRLHVGNAIIKRNGLEEEFPTWAQGSSASKQIRTQESSLEIQVSEHIGLMPFLWLEINDAAGPNTTRAYIERNSIVLLSNFGYFGTPLAVDPPSKAWLGHFSKNEIRKSGLWNVNYVTEKIVDPEFLLKLEKRVRSVKQSRFVKK